MKNTAAGDYCEKLLRDEEGALKEIRAAAEAVYTPVLGRLTAGLLKQYITVLKPERILEIGTATGYSGLLMLTSSAARLYTVDIDEVAQQKARERFETAGFAERVTYFTGDACEIVPLISGEFGFIFLDGPKSRYLDFLPFLIKLLPRGGVLFCDNVLFRGEVCGAAGRRRKSITMVRSLDRFLQTLSAEKALDTVVLPVGDGVSVSIKL